MAAILFKPQWVDTDPQVPYDSGPECLKEACLVLDVITLLLKEAISWTICLFFYTICHTEYTN